MIVGYTKPPLGELQHFGVKGMKWGVRGETRGATSMTSDQRIQRIATLRKKMKRLDMEKALMGIGLRGGAAQKIHQQRGKNNANYDPTGKSWTPEERAKFSTKVSSKAKRQSVNGAAIASGVLLGVGGLAVSALSGQGMHGDTLRTAQAGVVAIATIPMKQAYSNIRAIRTADKRQAILDEIKELERAEKRSNG